MGSAIIPTVLFGFIIFCLIMIVLKTIKKKKEKRKNDGSAKTLKSYVANNSLHHKNKVEKNTMSYTIEITCESFTGSHTPQPTAFVDKNVQRQTVQILESLQILDTTKNLDTLQGRYAFILQIYPTFEESSTSKRYRHDIQRGIDDYKTLYYDKTVMTEHVKLLLQPSKLDLNSYVADCIVACYKRFVEKQKEDMSKLKMSSAIEKRKENIIKVGYSAKYMFKTYNLFDNGQCDEIEEIRKGFYRYHAKSLPD